MSSIAINDQPRFLRSLLKRNSALDALKTLSFLLASPVVVAQPTDLGNPPMTASSPRISEPTNLYRGKPPFTAQEFWQKLLTLATEHDGSVSKERFEEVFEIKFSRERRSEDSVFYYLDEGKTWYFGVAINLFGQRTHVEVNSGMIVDWGVPSFGTNVGQCVGLAPVTEDLQKAGWLLSFQERDRASFDVLVKRGGKDRLSLKVAGDCVIGLKISIGR